MSIQISTEEINQRNSIVALLLLFVEVVEFQSLITNKY